MFGGMPGTPIGYWGIMPGIMPGIPTGKAPAGGIAGAAGFFVMNDGLNSAALALSVNALALGFSALLGFSPSARSGFFSSSFAFGGGGGEWGLGAAPPSR